MYVHVMLRSYMVDELWEKKLSIFSELVGTKLERWVIK